MNIPQEIGELGNLELAAQPSTGSKRGIPPVHGILTGHPSTVPVPGADALADPHSCMGDD